MKTQMLDNICEALSEYQDESKAQAFGITENEGTLIVKQLHSDSDIYFLIENINQDKLQDNYDYISFITYGWAAPLNNNGEIDGAPSEHPERRRVRLLMTVSKKENEILGSTIQFGDSNEIIHDEGTATGNLKEALMSLVS